MHTAGRSTMHGMSWSGFVTGAAADACMMSLLRACTPESARTSVYVCMLFISTVDQPIERVTIQALDCMLLLAVAPAQAGRAWGEGDISVA